MDPITRRQALRIASKVTLTFSMIACGASVASEDTDYSEGASEDAVKRGKKADAGNDCGTDALNVKETGAADAKNATCKPVAFGGFSNQDDSVAAKEGRACCRATLTAEISLGTSGAIQDTEENYACCSTLSRELLMPGAPEPGTDPAVVARMEQEQTAIYGACCGLYGWGAANPDGGETRRIVACTPWGPPVPPSMKIARKRFRKNTRKSTEHEMTEMNGVA